MEICQERLPTTPWAHPATARLPGIQPAPLEEWLRVDEAYGAQMAHREWLLTHHRDEVIACQPHAREAVEELYATVMDALPALGFTRAGGAWVCPDGRHVTEDSDQPLLTLGRLVQNDFCVHLQHPGAAEHHLAAAVLCFPAGWRLSDKIGRPLTQIHVPVDPYDESMARRVQRMFDALQPGRLLWRANALLYADPELFAPRSSEHRRHQPKLGEAVWMRSERQVLRKLPESGAVVFTIHTYVIPVEKLTQAQLASLKASPLWDTLLS
ncbi:MAG: DUF3445 domain-containing protein [Oceanicola sp.]|nr:DUF3445 domain-containing protein [Oceanicola sp.]